MFYETVELYQSINKDNWRRRAAEGMIRKFVDPQSPYAVNISSKARHELLTKKQFERDSFDSAKDELYVLMETNFFGKFISNNFDGGAANLAKYYKSLQLGMPRATEPRESNLARFDV
jgi:hypothetical protein